MSQGYSLPHSLSTNDFVLITAGPYRFLARLLQKEAPQTTALFRSLLPYKQKLIHVRWSGEGLWVPLEETDFKVPFENHTCHPSQGDFLLYPGGISETEFLLAYGGVSFASKMGPLAGSHFMKVVAGNENLPALGRLVLWKGAQSVTFEWPSEQR
jgi:hypothetical protein